MFALESRHHCLDGTCDVEIGCHHLPGYRWFGSTHSNNLIPLYAYGASAGSVGALATGIDTYTDAQGRTFGRGAYTDQAVLGHFLIATQVPEPASMALLGMGLLGLAGLRRRC